MLRALEWDRCSPRAAPPEGVSQLPKLLMLSLACCPLLASLPKSVGQPGTLQPLNLEGCVRLAPLRTSGGGLGALQTLNLVGCKRRPRKAEQATRTWTDRRGLRRGRRTARSRTSWFTLDTVACRQPGG